MHQVHDPKVLYLLVIGVFWAQFAQSLSLISHSSHFITRQLCLHHVRLAIYMAEQRLNASPDRKWICLCKRLKRKQTIYGTSRLRLGL